MNTKISEAAVEAASASMEATKNTLEMTPLDRIRLMLAAALPHLHPQPAELVEQQVVFQEHSTHHVYRGSCGSLPCYCWATDDHVIGDEVKRLAATGKQQVGDDCQSCKGSGEGRAIAGSGPDVYEVDALCSACGGTGAPAQQVGEVQGDADIVSRMRNMLSDIEQLGAAPMTVDTNLIRDAIAALTARQPGPQEAVAVVGSDFTLLWAGSGPIAPMVERHGLKRGSLLYAAPPAQGIDLGRFMDFIGFAIMQALSLPETDPRRDYIRKGDELLALIGKRDAAPGVDRAEN